VPVLILLALVVSVVADAARPVTFAAGYCPFADIYAAVFAKFLTMVI
jgi:hypothetical protein